MNGNGFSVSEVASDPRKQNASGFIRRGNAAIVDRKSNILNGIRTTNLGFFFQIEMLNFVRREKGDDDIDAGLPPGTHFVFKPIATPGPWHYRQSTRAWPCYPIEFSSHGMTSVESS